MTDELIRPALTPEEWAELAARGAFDRDKTTIPEWGDDEWTRLGFSKAEEGGVYVEDYWSQTTKPRAASAHVRPSNRHALAALCLYGQPFGFTQEDVEFLCDWLTGEHDTAFEGDDEVDCGEMPEDRSKRLNLANRIAALLPPPAPGA